MRFITLLVFSATAISAVPANPQRIVGGPVTTIDQYPSMVALLYTWDLISYSHVCGGTILNSRAILTAAHCLDDVTIRFRVRVGSSYCNSGGVVHTLAKVIHHHNYNPVTYDSDLAVMHTASPIIQNNNVRPGFISGPNYLLHDNKEVWPVGWGRIHEDLPYSSEQLRHVKVWTVNQEICKQRNAEVGLGVNDNMVCAGWLDISGRDPCTGDSGGPLFHNGVVVGIISFNYSCGYGRYPSVYVRVSRFTSWIQANAWMSL